MKKILSLIAIMLGALVGYSQAPGILNYQGVARNSVGNVLVNKTINLRLTIRDGSAAGPTVYQESRTVTTNPFGLFNVQVGSPGASGVTGTVAGVNWAVGAKFIQVEIDPNGGTTFINIGTAQLASVPYSLFAALSGDLVLPFNKTQADAGTLFRITNSNTTSAGATALEGLTNSTAANAFAIIGTVTSASAGNGSAGVRGINNGTGVTGTGVFGSHAAGGWGVYGVAPSGIGVYGGSTSGIGVFGISNTGSAGRFDITNAANTAPALLVNTNATGIGLRVNQTGTGQVTGIYGNISTTTSGSAAVLGTDFSSGGASPVDSRTYGVLGQTGTTGIAVGGFASNGGTALRGSGGGATGYALNVTGRVQLTGINEALNRILTSDASGNATWQDPSVIGVVTGSGTLNFVPKWTPNGTNLGNSLLFDDGTRMGIATTSPAYKLDVDATTGGGNGIRVRHTSSFATVDIIGVGNDQAIRFGKAGSLYSGINTLPDGDHINFFRFGGGQNLMSLNVNTGNLGVGGNPSAINAVAKVHVRGFNQANNLYLPPSGFGGVTGVASLDDVNATGNEKWGIHTYVDGSTLINHSIFAVPGTTGLDNTGLFARVSAAPAGAGNSYGLYAFDAVNNGTSTWAANIVGRMRYADGTQGAGRILISDAVGNASWQVLGGGVGIGGSGTLNYIPKWTPDGFNLGNSLLFDNANAVFAGTSPGGGGSTLNIGLTPSVTVPSVAFYTGSQGFNIHEDLNGKLSFEANQTVALGGNVVMTLDDDNARGVGIGTTNPSTKLNVVETDATAILSEVNYTAGAPSVFSYRAANMINSTNSNFGLAAFNNHSNVLIPAWKAAVMGIDSSNDIFSSGVAGLYKGNSAGIGVYGASAQNRAFESNATTSALGYVGGHFRGGDAGVHASASFGTGSAATKYGVYTSATSSLATNNYGIYAVANGASNNWAGYFDGRIAVVDGTEGVGKVLTSDASGNASWQGPVGIKLSALSAAVSAPFFTYVPITQWATVEYEKGSAGNYNSGTGEYTVPVSGTYHIVAHVLWQQPGATGSGYAGTAVFINGVAVAVGYDNMTSANQFSGNRVSSDINLIAGDLISIRIFHRTSGSVSLNGNSFESYWSADLIK